MEQGLVLTRDMALVLGLVGFSVLMLALDWLRADVVALLVLVVLGVARLVRVEQLFAGFAGDAVIAIMATMILGAGLDRTGVLGYAASFILRLSNGVERRLLLVLCGLTGLLSAVMQNPALTALFLPVVSRVSSRTGMSLSSLLLPMASCIMLGGTLTMVGNSPQILLNDLVASVNRNLPPGADTIEPFHMFSVTPVGVALLVAGLVFYGIWWERFRPHREDREIVTPARTETYFSSVYGIDGEIIECEVGPGSGVELLAEAGHGLPVPNQPEAVALYYGHPGGGHACSGWKLAERIGDAVAEDGERLCGGGEIGRPTGEVARTTTRFWKPSFMLW